MDRPLVDLFFDDNKTQAQKELIAVTSFGCSFEELREKFFKEVKEALIFDGYMSYFLKSYSFRNYSDIDKSSVICNLTSYYADFESIQKLARVPGITFGEVYMNDVALGGIRPPEMTIEVYSYEQDESFSQRLVDRIHQIQTGTI